MENKDIELVNKLNDLKQIAEKKCRDNNIKLSPFGLDHYRELMICRMKTPKDNKLKYECILYTIYFLLPKDLEYYKTIISTEVIYKFTNCMINSIEKSLNNDIADIENKVEPESNIDFFVESVNYNGKISYYFSKSIINMIDKIISKILTTANIKNIDEKYYSDVYVLYSSTNNWSIYEYYIMALRWSKKRFEDKVVWEDWWAYYMYKVTKQLLVSIDVTANLEKVKKYLRDGIQESIYD